MAKTKEDSESKEWRMKKDKNSKDPLEMDELQERRLLSSKIQCTKKCGIIATAMNLSRREEPVQPGL